MKASVDVGKTLRSAFFLLALFASTKDADCGLPEVREDAVNDIYMSQLDGRCLPGDNGEYDQILLFHQNGSLPDCVPAGYVGVSLELGEYAQEYWKAMHWHPRCLITAEYWSRLLSAVPVAFTATGHGTAFTFCFLAVPVKFVAISHGTAFTFSPQALHLKDDPDSYRNVIQMEGKQNPPTAFFHLDEYLAYDLCLWKDVDELIGSRRTNVYRILDAEEVMREQGGVFTFLWIRDDTCVEQNGVIETEIKF